MQTINLRCLFGLFGHKITLLAVSICCLAANAHAQKGLYNHTLSKLSKKNYYFGIALSSNFSKYHVGHHQSFLQNDTIQSLESFRGPAFNIAGIFNLKIGKSFDLRCTPGVSFADRRLKYKLTNTTTEIKKLESTFIEFPILFRYKSDFYKDIRVFVIGGFKYSVDLSSNSKARQAENLIKISPHDLAAELGIGFQIFFPYFILSPEVKYSHGVLNILERDRNLIYSSTIDKLFSQGLTITLNVEG
ncbi:MAG: PorT family protein [Aureispira sp.]|nr:PorT family protein [Aureispira sp.]